MDSIIKEIRNYLGLSQSEFAEKLKISFATVNRWENGRTIPNKLTQSAVYELCTENNIPVYDLVMRKIKETADRIATEDGRIVLYHGSKSGIEGDIAPKSRKQCDFGAGFYMGTEPSQALSLICDYEKSLFYILSVDMKEMSVFDVPADINWAMLVAFNRGKMEKIRESAFYVKYRDMIKDKDIIVGNIADDRMFYVIDNFFIGNITDVALVNSLSALQLGKQYVAVSDNACKAVRIEKEINLSYLERLCIKDFAEKNRAKGISLANEICRNYRREGLYFDEILDKAMGENK